MTRTRPIPEKYSVIEIALCGRDLRPEEKETARDLLRRARFTEKGMALAEHQGAFCLSVYTRSEKKVREVREKYRALQGRPFRLRVKALKRRDWFDKWKRDYHIRPLGAKFVVVPVWERSKFKKSGRTPIYLEPGSAFGSGYHETTRLMTRLLESLQGRIGSFLDAGCGTGILSVAASKLGAREIRGFDHDRPSAAVAGENFRANGCEGGTFVCARLKSLKSRGRFDTVGANLLSRILLENRDRLLACVRPGGHLLVSGIARGNLPEFKREFARPGLRCLKILRGRRWAAGVYRKTKYGQRGHAIN